MKKRVVFNEMGPIGDATSLSIDEVTDALENKMIANRQAMKVEFPVQ